MNGLREWLLDSPKRFVAVVTAAVLTVILTALYMADPPPQPVAVERPAPRPSAAPTRAPEPTPTPTPTVTVTETPSEAPPDRHAVEAAAAAWVRDWLAVRRPPGEWRAEMAKHATDHVTSLMRSAVPDGVPRTSIDDVRAVQASSTFALVQVRLANHDRLDVSVVLEPGGWRVAQVGGSL